MKSPITHKKLIDWAGKDVVEASERMITKGLVMEANRDGDEITGRVVVGSRTLKTALTILDDGNIESHCPCYDNRERGIICTHVIALALTLVKRATDPEREIKYQEEQRRASRIEKIDETEYIKRAKPDTPGAIHASIHITLDTNWQSGLFTDKIPVICEASAKNNRQTLDNVTRDIPLILSKEDEAILFVLEDIAEGPAPGRQEMSKRDFINLIRLCRGRTIEQVGGIPITVNNIAMKTVIRIDLDHETGELIVIAHTPLPNIPEGKFPTYIISGRTGWIYGADNLWPISNVLPEPYHPIYSEPIIIPRSDVLRFFKQEISQLEKICDTESELTFDLFTTEPASPQFILKVKGSSVALAATLIAKYDNIELIAGKPSAEGNFSLPDKEDILSYKIRNIQKEHAALTLLRHTGFSGERGDTLSGIVGEHGVLNFLGTHLPTLRREGWKIEMDGRVCPYMDSLEFATPVVNIDDGDGWFDVGFNFEDMQGMSISPAEIQLAIRKNSSYIKQGNKTILLDNNAIESMYDVFADCSSGDSNTSGHFRMSNIYAGFVKSSLDAMDGIDIEDTLEWRKKSSQSNRKMELEPIILEEPLASTLRPYQKEGVQWLRFLEKNGFCGILADEMGLGKTLQTLTWINLKRTDNNGKEPVLIVCPTSLVYNWAEEAEKFVPHLRILTLSGSDRHSKYDDILNSDIAITSYAILRRDLDKLLETNFSAVILDEAQHIKNRSTQNALAVKQIKANHKLVLTGTPIENSVNDLWSIMDFLMPGYLGNHQTFKANYEKLISNGGEEADYALRKLHRKMQPFLLRRLKTKVAKDLPAKIEKVAFCELTPDQNAVYQELLAESQRKISNMVATGGFNKSRMEILTILLRLRQVCCHLDLLKMDELKSDNPSAKMTMFLEFINEAIDGGHRILVFSQFVSMLHLLRDQLKSMNIPICYLDGSTKDRMKAVHQFNTERDIPIFLISLKAGGTGLNLTGADMVIHFDPWWNPAVEDQATDRAHRIGQKRTVYNIKLITRNTIEEKVLAMQRKKKAVINATLESDKQMMKSLSWEDVQSLLSL